MNISQKSRLAALLLAFFLGVFGAHRFYVKKTGSAVAMLLITCTFVGVLITGIWALVDTIMILVGSFTDGEGRVVSDWNPAPGVIPPPRVNPDDIAKYAELRDKGILTEEEFQKKKTELLK